MFEKSTLKTILVMKKSGIIDSLGKSVVVGTNSFYLPINLRIHTGKSVFHFGGIGEFTAIIPRCSIPDGNSLTKASGDN
ncbi:hypothetical protein D3C86_1044060 [compost metagenome]